MLKNIKSAFSKLLLLLDKRRKFFLIVLFFMVIFLSLIETAGVSIIMPFISAASNPDIVNTGYYNFFYELLGFKSADRFVIFFGIAIIIFYFFRAVYNMIYTYIVNKFAEGSYRHFATRLFKTYLALPYKTFVKKNPSIMTQVIVKEAQNLSYTLLNFLKIFTEFFTLLLLYFFLVMVNWQITLVLTIILILTFFVVFNTLIRTSKKLGEKRYEANVNLSKTIWGTLNNFKFIKLKGNQKKLLNDFNDSAAKLTRATVISSTISSIPKNILENLGFSLLIATVCFIIWRYESAEMVIPVITMYALAMYRMLPAITRVLEYYNKIAYNLRSLDKTYEELNLQTDQEDSEPLFFSKYIRGENIVFYYNEGADVIKNISFEIRAGEKIAFTGESGCGKTTLVDIIIGVYRPISGNLYVDDVLIDNNNIRSWRGKIGYIPQDIYLFDGTVADNVAFGSDDVDEKKVKIALEKAKILNFLETKDGINTIVGDRGIQLSGGQKQRVGIARALYNDPEILVLDEATSSLDDATEADIMDEIYDVSGNKTLIIIAHRLSTVQRCDRKIRIESGNLKNE